MLKMTRLAMLATALVLAMPSALAPSVAMAQGQPAPAATPATPPAAAPPAVTPPAAPAAAPAPAAKVGEKTTEIIDSLEMVSVKIVNSIAERVSYVRPPAKGAEGGAPMPHAPVPSHA